MKIKKVLFLIMISIFCFIPAVKAEDDVIIKSINPISSTEGVAVNSHSKIDVGFNDLNQTIKYRVILENNTNRDLYLNKLEVIGSSQEFIKYTIDDSSRSKVIKPNKDGKITLIVTTLPGKQAGRNLNDNIKLKFLLNNSIENPQTSSNLITTIILVIISAVAITFVMTKFNNKKGTIATVIVCFILLGTSFVFADDTIVVEMVGTGNVTYTSQNYMESSGRTISSGTISYTNAKDIWTSTYYNKVKNINIIPENNNIETYAHSFDLTINDKQRVKAYLVENGDQNVPYDLYIISNGVIYAPEDATGLFGFKNVETINGLENIIFDNTTKMTGMFIGNEILKNLNISNLNTTNVRDTSYMFYRNYNLNLDESKFNLEKIENKTQMFSESKLYKIIENSHDGSTVKKYTGEGSTDYKNDVYYYYGNVTNNNIRFANFCWKIVRTTEAGGIKLLYSGIPSENGSCSNSGSSLTIGATLYNEKTSLADVSYVYDDGKDSIIKTYIDSWYENNLIKYAEKLEDSVWCNNRIIYQEGPFVTPNGLSCPGEKDGLTVKSKKLKYPIALLTENELLLAGLERNRYTDSYLNTGYCVYVFTMSPYWSSGTISIFGHQGIQERSVNDGSYVRPAISLNNSAKIIAGIGTAEEPYVVE